MKKCFKCGKIKPLDEFYKHKQMSDGHLNKCKVCTRTDTSKRLNYKMKTDPEFIESEAKRHREKYHRLGYKDKFKPSYEAKKKIMDRFNSKYPEKVKARRLTTCLKPKIKGNHLHHWSYNDEHLKDVIELNINTHYNSHRFLKYDKECKMYRTLEGVLLDSKMKHLRYLVKYKNAS